MITKLSLKNFRCFENFTLDGIAPVTLIAGANNVGKSTILESIFLFMARQSSDVFIKLNHFRGLPSIIMSPKMMWEFLFGDMNLDRPIEVSITDDRDIKQNLLISKDESFSISAVPNMANIQEYQATQAQIVQTMQAQIVQAMQAQNLEIYPLRIVFTDSVVKEEAHFLLSSGMITLYPEKPFSSKVLFAQYFSGRMGVTPAQVSDLFGKLLLIGKKSMCIDFLQRLDSRIKDLFIITIGGIIGLYADIGLSSLLPINMLGDGINKLMQISFAMLANPNGVFLIDEIENGFHYSFYPKLWEVIGALAKETNSQVFATTHSYECISGATVLAYEDKDSNLFRFIRLDKTKDGITAPKLFENDSFEFAIANELEVR